MIRKRKLCFKWSVLFAHLCSGFGKMIIQLDWKGQCISYADSRGGNDCDDVNGKKKQQPQIE